MARTLCHRLRAGRVFLGKRVAEMLVARIRVTLNDHDSFSHHAPITSFFDISGSLSLVPLLQTLLLSLSSLVVRRGW
jgi:hypothetical protein